MNYNESKISKLILSGLEEMGFVKMTPIQEMAIPELMEGRDVIGQAQTGTGKTAAFGIPMIESIDPKDNGIQGLIMCPTRELAIQASEELKKMAKNVSNVKVVAIYGGQDIERQFRALKGKVSIVVGTPGRIMDHMRRGTLKFDNLKMLVLDEADEMLNMGFREDIETICKALPRERQTALFSATMPKEIIEITKLYQRNAKHVKVEQEELTIPLVKQNYYVVKGREKDGSLCRLLDYMSPKRALIFCNTKRKVDQLTLMLKGRGYAAEALHGDLSQHQRDRVMSLFRNGNLELLLATDVAARGIDVDDVDMVFNYDMPQDMEYYVHRIGRTGRAGKKGKAISLITSREKYKIDSLEKYCHTDIKKKELPTAAGAMSVKAYKHVSDAVEYCQDMDMKPYMEIVFKRCEEDGLDPLEVAAAFLRQSLGDMEVEPKQESRAGRSDRPSRRRDSGDRGDRRSSASSGKRKSGKSGKDYGGDDKKRSKNGKRKNSGTRDRGYDKRRTGSGKK